MGRDIRTELKRITKLELSEEEKSALIEKGINLKNPTKLTLLAAALYEKAAKGDLSALKELISRLDDELCDSVGVVLIDDIKNSS